MSKRRPSKSGRRKANAPKPGSDELARIALGLFADRHFDSVTIKDIGRAANVNSAMIYYYFENKEALFRAAIESAVDGVLRLFEEHNSDHCTPADAISNWIDVNGTLRQDLRSFVKISLDCKGVIGPGTNEPIQKYYRREREILQKYLGEGMSQGLFKPMDPVTTAALISATLGGIMVRSLIQPDFDMQTFLEECKKALWVYLGYHVPTSKEVRGTARTRTPRKAQ